jgi:hypothetical protein
MAAAAVEEKGFRPGMVSVVQTFGEGAKFHPHVHALCSRGGWTASGEWIPLPYADEAAAENDPLICPRCGSEMPVVGFITQPALIDRILDHLRRRDKIPRPPPLCAQPLATPA